MGSDFFSGTFAKPIRVWTKTATEEPAFGKLSGILAILLVCVSIVCLEISAHKDHILANCLMNAGFPLFFAMILFLIFQQYNVVYSISIFQLNLVVLAAFILPQVIEPIRRAISGEGYPLELRIMFGLSNIAIVMGALSRIIAFQRVACIISLFLILFASVIDSSLIVVLLMIIHGSLGGIWLWANHRAEFGAYSIVPVDGERSIRGKRNRLLVLGFGVFFGILVMALLAAFVGPSRVILPLWEFFPTSGGTGDMDPFARDGIGDGDEQMAGGNPNSTGNVDTDIFLDSPLPSLFDMQNDMFGEPYKPKDQQRTIAIDGQTNAKEGEKPPADSQRIGRDFSTVRNSPNTPKRDPGDQESRAIFEVEGRTPLHVRVLAYDLFDGKSWNSRLDGKQREGEFINGGEDWMIPAMHSMALEPEMLETHKFRLTKSTGLLVPTPTRMTKFRIKKVGDSSLFAFSQPGIVKMSQRTVPSGITITTQSRLYPRDYHPLPSSVEFPLRDTFPGTKIKVDAEILELVRKWKKDPNFVSDPVDYISKYMVSNYIFDPTADFVFEEKNEGPTNEIRHEGLSKFLFETKRGHSYHFATATANFLWLAGYETRIVNGFYVAPKKYDYLTGMTPVNREDLHFWTEVCLPGGEWYLVETTPGFYPLVSKVPFYKFALGQALMLMQNAWEKRWFGVSFVGFIFVCYIYRYFLFDFFIFQIWKIRRGNDMSTTVKSAISILEWRARWAGFPRPVGMTIRQWLGDCNIGPIDSKDLLDWAVHGDPENGPFSNEESRKTIINLLKFKTITRYKRENNI